MELNALLVKLDHGDPLSDAELDYLIDQLTVVVKILSSMNYKAYWLMYIDLSSKLRTCEGYKSARQEHGKY